MIMKKSMIFNEDLIHYGGVSKTFKFFYVLTFMSIVIFACRRDDNSGMTDANQDHIIGIWRFQSSTTDGIIDTDYDPCLTLLTLTFTDSQITTDVYGDNCEMSETYVNGYSIAGNTISINDEGDIYDSEITTLNDTTLKIEEAEEGIIYIETYIK